MEQTEPNRVTGVINWVAIIIIALLPFHEFLTTWLGDNFGYLPVFRIWKEILILICSFFIIYLISKKPVLKRWVRSDPLILLIWLYVALTILLGLWAYHNKQVNIKALGDGLIIDLRYFAFFGITAVLTYYSDFLKSHWREAIIIPGVLVLAFGVAQLFLQPNFLSHFGYGAKTIPAYATVNSNKSIVRIQSTLRGPDPLGAYIVVLVPAILIGLRKKYLKALLIALSLIVLYFTYSRSGVVGLVVALVVLAYLEWVKPAWRKTFVIVLASLAVLGLLGVLLLRNNTSVQNVLFHTQTGSVNPSSNAARVSAWESGIRDIIHQPLGGGTGTAGPASVHNNHPARIAENYYLQIGQEIGVIGLAIFVAINIIVGVRLYKRRDDPFSAMLLAIFIGVSVINMTDHAWADDVLSLIWWGLAGIALTPAIIKGSNPKQKVNAKTRNHQLKKVAAARS